MRIAAISGVTGFVGRHLLQTFVENGWEVIGLCRHPEQQSAIDSVSFRYYDLSDASCGLDLHGVDVLIHCAIESYRYRGKSSQSVNVDGSRRLFDTARKCGVKKIVFISSIAARDGTSSSYGDHKLLIESLLDNDRDLVIRPGLVIGDGGIFRALYASIRKFRVAPIFLGGLQPVYTIGVQNLGRALHDLMERDRAGTFVFASRDPVTTRSLYQEIARKAGVEVHLIPLPYRPTLWTLEIVEHLGFALPISSSNLKGIRNMRSVDFRSYQYPDVAIQSFASAMNGLRMSDRTSKS
jgi:nucleoside-diphosphate-sugar epimerase